MKQPPPDDAPGVGRKAPTVSGGTDRYEALAQLLEEEAGRAARARAARTQPTAPSDTPRVLFLSFLLVLTAWVWILPPSWVKPVRVQPPPLHEEEASLRFLMYLQAQRIRVFELQNDGLPLTLEAAGPAAPGMSYRLLDDAEGYELTGSTDRVRLVYRSDQPLRAWVGAGAEVVGESRIR